MYYVLLLYTIIFYSCIADRLPFIAPLRLEFIVGFILVSYSLSKIVQGKIKFNENRLNLAYVLFILIAFITIPFAFIKSTALDTFVKLLKFFSIYLMIIATIDTEKKLRGFIYIYMVMIALLFVEPFLLSLQGKGFVYNNHMWRLGGTTHYFGHPNHLGMLTAVNLPFIYYLMKFENRKFVKLLYLSLFLIAMRVIMLTESRTGFVGLMVFGLVIWLSSKKKLRSLFVMVFICLMLWQVAPEQTKERFLSLSNVTRVVTTEAVDFSDERFSSLGSMASRWELIRRGIIMFAENPIIGVGINCYGSYQGHKWGYWFPPHNTYIQALAEMGIIGFIIFIYVITIIFNNLKYSKFMMKKMQEEHTFVFYINSALTAYLLVLLVLFMFGQDLYNNYLCWGGALSLVIMRIAKGKMHNNVVPQDQVVLDNSVNKKLICVSNT